ncbi:hypothetical protein HKX48_003621 [Thoreauomyces humboldtii]|nr:hypothetical protein HKX48_003621 [Thoreauomyces humboldtii]
MPNSQAQQQVSPTAPEFAVTAERLASLKSRLQAISVKHAHRRASQDQSGQNSPRMSISAGSPGDTAPRSSLESLGPSEASTSADGLLGSDDALDTLLDQRPEQSPAATAPDEIRNPSDSCPCRSVMNPEDPTMCSACLGVLHPVMRLEKERASLSASLAEEKRKVRSMEHRQDASTNEMAVLRNRVHDLEEAVAAKDLELVSVKADLDRLGQKLVDEVEVRAELQHSKDAVQEELEELSRSLFEEANSMVATEARSRHEHQVRESTLRVQMTEMQLQLQMERDQLKELRLRMENMEGDSRSSTNALTDSTRLSVYSSNSSVDNDPASSSFPPEDAIDSVLFAEFEEFISASPDVRLTKMHALPFMKNALEDDVSPCLRFGGNPRTSTKKLIDAITANTCFVEEINPAQLANLEARRARPQESSRVSSPRLSASPTRTDIAAHSRSSNATPDLEASSAHPGTPVAAKGTIFNKTVMERLSNAFSSGTLALSSSSSNLASILNTCSACGRSQYSSTSSQTQSAPAHSASQLQQAQSPIRFQFRTSDTPDDVWNPICLQCRDRLVAVCEFYNFARHVRQGLYSTRRPHDLYLEVLTLKRRMFYARIGAAKFADGDKSFNRKKARPNSNLLSPTSSSLPALSHTNGEAPTPVTATRLTASLRPPSIASADFVISPTASVIRKTASIDSEESGGEVEPEWLAGNQAVSPGTALPPKAADVNEA